MNCVKCGLEKKPKERCKNCKRILNKKYTVENSDKLKNYHKQYNQDHKQKLNETSSQWYSDNKEKVSQQYKNNVSKKTHKRNYNNDYERNRKMIDPAFKLRKNCSRLMAHAMNGSKNGQSILKYLSYTMEELKIHLENQFDSNMSWENYGSYWHIDHVYPQSLLPYTSMDNENFNKCWALTNLRPLEAIENMKKSNKIVSL